MPTSSGIPIVYRGQQFPSRKALAKHLAPLLGKSVGALAMALSRYDVEHVTDRIQNGVRLSAENTRPISYRGQQFPSRASREFRGGIRLGDDEHRWSMKAGAC